MSGKDKVTAADVQAIFKRLGAPASYSAPVGRSSGLIRSARYDSPVYHVLAPNKLNPLAGKNMFLEVDKKTGKTKFKNGIIYDKLDDKTKKAVDARNQADMEAAALGAKRKPHKSWYMKGLDYAFRPMNAVEGAVSAKIHGQFKQQNEMAKNHKTGLFDELKAFLGPASNPGEIIKGGWKGLKGEEHHSGSEIVQQVADSMHAAKHGRTEDQVVKGEGHVNKYAKFGVGLGVDIALDPLTYATFGTSAIAKGGAKAGAKLTAQHLEDAAKLRGTVTDVLRQAKAEEIARGMANNAAANAARSKALARKGLVKPTDVVPYSAKSAVPAVAVKPGVASLVPLTGEFAVNATHAGITAATTKKAVSAKLLHISPAAAASKATKEMDVAAAEIAAEHAVKLSGSLDKMLGLDKTFLTNLSKKQLRALSPAAQELYHSARAAKAGEKAVKYSPALHAEHLAKVVNGKSMAIHAEDLANEVVKKAQTQTAIKAAENLEKIGITAPSKTLRGAASRAEHTAYKKALGKEQEKLLAEIGLSGGKNAARELSTEIAETTLRSLSPAIRREFKIGALGMGVTVPGVASVGRGVARGVKAVPGSKRAEQLFTDTFRANAHIPQALTKLRLRMNGTSGNLIREYAGELQSVYGNVDKATRHETMKAWRGGYLDGLRASGGVSAHTAVPVENIGKHFDTEIKGLQESMNQLGVSNKELNAWLPKRYQIDIPDQATLYKTVGKNTKQTEKLWELTQNRLIQTVMKNKAIDDPAHALLMYNTAMAQLAAKRTMLSDAAERFGVPMRRANPTSNGTLALRMTDTLKKQGYRELGKEIPGIEKGLLFPPDIATGLERMDHVFSGTKAAEGLLHNFDRATQVFKSVVTRYHPTFHVRTLMGEMMLGYIGGMKNIPKSYGLAGRVIAGRNKEFMAPALQGLEGGVSRSVVQRANVLGFGDSSHIAATQMAKPGQVVVKTRLGNLTADQLWHEYMNSGLKTGFVSSDLVKSGADRAVLRGPADKVAKGVHLLSESVEDYGRLAHFIDDVMHNKTAKTLREAFDDAAETVSKYHLDYTAVTKAERNVATRIVPFYKWIRLSTPLMVDAMLHNPSRVLQVPKGMAALSGMAGYDPSQQFAFPGGPDAVMPSFLRDHGAVPIGNFGGNTNYYDPTALFPLASSAELASGWSAQMGKINPLIRDPFEIGLDKGAYQRSPRSDMSHYLLSQTPQTKFGESMVDPQDPDISRLQLLFNLLANPGIQPNTPKRMASEALRERDAAYKNRLVAQKKKGIRGKDGKLVSVNHSGRGDH